MHLRPATPADAERAGFINYHSWQQTYRGLIADDFLDQMVPQEYVAKWQRILQQQADDRFTSVLENEAGLVVGYVSGGPVRQPYHGCQGEIYALYLLQPWHGRGWGAQLFVEGVRQLQQRSYDSFCLYVLSKNPAVAFYRSFQPDIEDHASVNIGEQAYCDLGMGWKNMEQFKGK